LASAAGTALTKLRLGGEIGFQAVNSKSFNSTARYGEACRPCGAKVGFALD